MLNAMSSVLLNVSYYLNGLNFLDDIHSIKISVKVKFSPFHVEPLADEVHHVFQIHAKKLNNYKSEN